MQSRQQTRRAAILPIKLHLDEEGGGKRTVLAHTTDISRSGCRVTAVEEVPEGSIVTVEYKHHRSHFRVTWCLPSPGSKYQMRIGLKKVKPDPHFWGIELPHGKEEMGNFTSYRKNGNGPTSHQGK